MSYYLLLHIRTCHDRRGCAMGSTSPPPGTPSATTADLDALGAAADLQLLGDSAARYPHADWEREQKAEPTYQATMRYIILGRPLALPADFLSCFPSHHQRPSFWEIQELASKGRLHAIDDGIVQLVHN